MHVNRVRLAFAERSRDAPRIRFVPLAESNGRSVMSYRQRYIYYFAR